MTVEFDPMNRKESNGLYCRGGTDSYYHRSPRPHYRLDNLGVNKVFELTPEQVAEYMAGWNDNEDSAIKRGGIDYDCYSF